MMGAGPRVKWGALAKAVGLPEIVVTDAGHAAGKRMRDYEGFADPASPKNALLVECGQHWEAASALIAIHSALRFLLVNGVVDADWASQGLAGLDLPEQRFVEVTGPVDRKSTRLNSSH